MLVVQHEDECPPAWFGRWLEGAGCALDVRRPYAGEQLPAELDEHDGMLVLGGHMGAYDDADFPWLAQVKALVRRAAESEVPVFGICLGHQLVTVALGGSVHRNPRGQQLGVLPVGWAEVDDPVLGSRPSAAIQWNDDVVESLPGGAVELARTADGEVQAARFAPTVWGVQSHPEADRTVVQQWAEDDRSRHPDAVIDAALAAVDEARSRLLAEWAPVAAAFADQVRGRARAVRSSAGNIGAG